MDILSGRSLPAKRTRERKEVHAEKEKIQKNYSEGKFEINLAGWGIGCCILMLFCVPILGNTLGNETTYSEVLLDGEVIGAVADPEEVDQAFLNARAKIARGD